MSDSFYRAFEDRHRGSRELIKSRLRGYAPFLQALSTQFQPATAIDLGCGRGEWLEILSEHAFEAYGVDLDDGMLDGCRERGLNARKAEAIASLRELPAESIALVSAFHVVEHMPFASMRTLIDEALRVLKPGGLLILETPNPENLVVGSSSFYQDPSHERPIPPELLRFAVEHAGYHRTKVLGLQESPELRSGLPPRLLDVLNGVSPDYAVVAQKSANAEILSGFDAIFATHYGISLADLAERYDRQAKMRNAEITEMIHETEIRLTGDVQQLRDHITQLERQFTQLEANLAQAGDRITHAEAQAAQFAGQIHALLHSRSWRITAPMRYVGGIARRIRTAIREDRVGSGAKRHIKLALRRLAFALGRHPRLMHAAIQVLNRFPGIKHRLRSIMHQPDSVSSIPTAPTFLSPRASRIYDKLKKAIDARKT